jgi:hypothetical protein
MAGAFALVPIGLSQARDRIAEPAASPPRPLPLAFFATISQLFQPTASVNAGLIPSSSAVMRVSALSG